MIAKKSQFAQTHTPGPWAYNAHRTRNADRIITHDHGEFGQEQIAYALDFNEYSRDDEADANARLIAAAPDLLQALEKALPFFRESDEMLDGTRYAPMIRAAIAKATGGQP